MLIRIGIIRKMWLKPMDASSPSEGTLKTADSKLMNPKNRSKKITIDAM